MRILNRTTNLKTKPLYAQRTPTNLRMRMLSTVLFEKDIPRRTKATYEVLQCI